MPLDSSPLAMDTLAPPHALPHAYPNASNHNPNPLKRSLSQASILTPPQTVRKRANYGPGAAAAGGRVREESVSVTVAVGGDGQAGDVFGAPVSMTMKRKKVKENSRVTSHRRPTPATTQTQTQTQCQIQPSVPTIPIADVASNPFLATAPTTPPRKAKALPHPTRDSPNNPFLDAPATSTTGKKGAFKLNALPRIPIAEQPTINYVYRGVRQTFTNPLFGAPTHTTASSLPLSHPDYSPAPNLAPRLLFPPGSTKESIAKEKERDAGDKLRTRVGNVEDMEMVEEEESEEETAGATTLVERLLRLRPTVQVRGGRENARV